LRDLEAFTSLGIKIARRGLTVTGVPVGTVSFVEHSLPDRLERMGRVLPWFPRLHQPQTAARLLSACVSTRPQYLTRTVPPSPAVISSFTRWDTRLGETFQQLLALGTWACREDVREAALDQIFLPIRLGGFGIRRMARIAPVSYVCSWVQCAPILCSLPACGEVFRQSFASGERAQIDQALQTALEGLPPDVLSLLPFWPSCASASPNSLFAGASRLLEAHALEAVRARHTSPLHLARLTNLQGVGAGALLQSVPYADPLRIPEAQWQVASSSRFGLPIPQLALTGQCPCGQAIDDVTVPHHAVRCPRFGVAMTIHDTVKFMLRDFAVEAGFAVKVEDSMLFTQLEAARARLQGQPVVGEGTRAGGLLEQRGEVEQLGCGGQWGQHHLRGRVARGAGGQRGQQGEQTGRDGEGGQQRQQKGSQRRPQAQGAAPPGLGSGVGQGREQQGADGGTGGAAGSGGEDQGVREVAGDRAGGLGGLGEGREGEGRGQVGGGEDRERETTREEAPRDQTGQQPAQQQGPVGRTSRVGTTSSSRIPDLTCRDVGQTLVDLVDVSIADPQWEGNVQLRRATPTQIGVAAARRVQEKLRHWGPHLEGLQPAPHFYACVAETFGLLSEPLRQFLGICAKRIAQWRRDRGGGDDGSARIFEAGLTTRLSVALQRAQAQCIIQHAVRQLGGSDDEWMPTPVPLSAGQGTWHHITGCFETSVPYTDPLRIPEAQWQVASSSRLGLPIPQLALTGQCSCGQAIDDMTVPHHAVRCPRFGVAMTIHDTVKFMLRDFAVEAGFAVKVEDSMLFTQLEAARARLQGQPVVGEGTRAGGLLEQRGEVGQLGCGGQWGQHQLRGRVARGAGGQRGQQGEQTGRDGEGGQQRQQQGSQRRPQAQGVAPPGLGSGVGQWREQQGADGGTGGAAGSGGEDQGVREAAGDQAGGLGGLGEGREGEGRGQVGGGEDRGRETTREEAPRDQTGQQPAQQQGPVGRTGRVGTTSSSRIPDLTCRDVGQTLMVLVDVSIADPQREGNVQLRRATPTQIGVAAARRVQEKLRHWGPHLEGLQPAPHFYACVAETFGLLSEPLRQFLGICAKRIAQRRRDRGGGDDGSARIFEAGLTTRLSVALQRAQAQCIIQHAVRQLGGSDDGWMPTPVPLSAGQSTWHHITGCFETNGITLLGELGKFTLKYGEKKLGMAVEQNGVFVLNFVPERTTADSDNILSLRPWEHRDEIGYTDETIPREGVVPTSSTTAAAVMLSFDDQGLNDVENSREYMAAVSGWGDTTNMPTNDGVWGADALDETTWGEMPAERATRLLAEAHQRVAETEILDSGRLVGVEPVPTASAQESGKLVLAPGEYVDVEVRVPPPNLTRYVAPVFDTIRSDGHQLLLSFFANAEYYLRAQGHKATGETWHKRLGHPSQSTLNNTIKAAVLDINSLLLPNGLELKPVNRPAPCTICPAANLSHEPFPTHFPGADDYQLMDKVYSDILN
ncbi:unnamed protein product, partial [Closterium sp. NIES-54]